MYRRDFIRLTALAAGTLPLSGHARTLNNSILPEWVRKTRSAGDLYEIFRDPVNQYRPFVRWWWNGDKLQATEILRELDVLKAAGIGGVEINPIRFPGEADAMGIPSLTYLSDEWLDMLEVAVKGAKEKGIICDMIVGSGWPFGGEFLARKEQCQMIALGTRNLAGGQKVQISRKELLDSIHPEFHSPYKDPAKELFAIRMVPAQLNDPGQSILVDDRLQQETITIDVPDGPHVLYYLAKLTGFMAVINGAPGASGPVLNHYDAPSVQKYLDRISGKISERLGHLGNYFRAFFTDSIELEGANWCSDMYAQFRKRRGYDLAPWFPFVLFKVGEMGNAVKEKYGAEFSPQLQRRIELVRYDFEITKRELFHERFIKTFAGWCTQHGVQSRMQAYGMDCDPITGGMMVDIPECETWIWTDAIEDFGDGDYRRGRNYTMINKFVSSSAHLAGKRLISCEELTNTGDPFHGTLERIKLAGDQSILSGVTATVLHGFNYSPLEAPFPGWIRYGSYFNERNTWWPYFKCWTDYKARLSALFQQCDMQAGVAVLHPMADMASKYGFQRDPYPNVTYPSYVHKIWEAIHQNGHGCDYISEEIIANCKIGKGKLVYRNCAYSAILFPEVETITTSTAKVLQQFAKAGGRIIFINKTPHLSAGLINHDRQSKQIAGIINALLRRYPNNTGITNINEKDMVGWFGQLAQQYKLQPEVKINRPVDYISTLHYADGENDLFFFVNYSGAKSNTFEAEFNTGNKEAWYWNPETGERFRYPVTGAKNVLTITMAPAESTLIVFGPAAGSAETSAKQLPLAELSAQSVQQGKHRLSIPGPWEVTFHHVNGVTQRETLQALKAFDQNSNRNSFAGTIEYRNKFYMAQPGSRTWLDLGHLRDVSELEVNGRRIGVRWYGQHLYDITDAVEAGDNYITIRVITTLGNYMQTLKHNKTAQAWTARRPYYAFGLDAVMLFQL